MSNFVDEGITFTDRFEKIDAEREYDAVESRIGEVSTMTEKSQRAGTGPAEPRRWKASGDKPSGGQDQRLRIQFELTAAMLKEVDELVERGAFESRRDLFNSAYDLLQWAIDETTKGRLIAAVDEDSGIYTAIHLPALAAVRRRIRKPRELRPVRPAALRSAR